MCIKRYDQCTKCNLSFNQKTKPCDRYTAQNQGWLAQCLGIRRACNRVVCTKPLNIEWYCPRCRGPITAPMQPHQMMSYRGPTWQDPPPLTSQQRQLLQQQAQKNKGKKSSHPGQQRAATDPILPLAAVKQPDSERNLMRSNAIRRHRTTSEASALQRPDQAWVASEERTRRLRREDRSVAPRSRGPEGRSSSKKKRKGEPEVKVPLYIPPAGDPTNPNLAWAKYVVESKSKSTKVASGSSSSSKASRCDGERPNSSHPGPPAGFTYEKWQTEDPPRRKPSTKAAAPSASYTSLPRAKKSHPPVTQLKSRPRAASAGATMRGLISPMFRRAASPDWVCADAKLIEKGNKK
ncbi:hypothetical protein MCOR27_006335 [Pyricularia oryzae]|uniref:Uncharacterized protein n=2 Tax=Pyricularia TaxID=48558 RepID=A0ABQ8P047_PYRGI|nr:hypothetical protein MCOR01_007594 [Pyricularia oryzae]KAI6304619.1 hypothetical protein MCOR33_000469 [Pyricularia grisea]KAH9433766.1 hypothetical protein MCOR02_005807 [Pyricularia oryzae]KAI6260185.1 hypothetical protein MCOR19_003500 [Pyricularia oryzae]KAI6276728.1 hypothetical protein MCOR27_006335 [Pyricularia oryzae]